MSTEGVRGIAFAAIVPLHDKRAYVAAAIDSILAQTHPAAEIIVVDDASSDGGGAIVAAICDPRLSLLHRDTPGPGGYAARNLAIAQSCADWLVFLDADDVWHLDHLAVLSEAIAANPAAGCVATRYDHVFADRRAQDVVAPRLRGPATVPLDLAGFLECWLAAQHCPVWTGAVAVRRDVALRVGLFPEGRAVRGGDKDFWLRVVGEAGLVFVPRATADFTRDADNKVTDRTDTRSLPCLVPTARAMLTTATPRERRLLAALINQEVMLYARWAVLSGARSTMRLRDLVLPAHPGIMVALLFHRYAPLWLARSARRLRRAYRRSPA